MFHDLLLVGSDSFFSACKGCEMRDIESLVRRLKDIR